MVQELKTASKESKGDRTLDLSALGKVKNTRIGAAEKPPLLEPTDATIKSVEIKIEDKFESNQDDPTKLYHPGYVIFETEYMNPKTKEMMSSKDYFRGLRVYVALDENLSPVRDENGDDVIDRFWIGDRSGLGKILGTVRKYCQGKGTPLNDYVEFFQFFKPGMKVKIKSQFNTNPQTDQQTIKQQIVDIV